MISKKIIMTISAMLSLSSISYADINLWEQDNLERQIGYTGLEIGSIYNRKNISEYDSLKEQRFLDEVYGVKSFINNNLKLRVSTDKQEKDNTYNLNIDYLSFEELDTPIYNFEYGILNDITKYGISFSMFKGESFLKNKNYDNKGGQVNLYFNRNEELGNLFGTAYIGKNDVEYNDTDNLYFGYFGSFEQKYESFDFNELYTGIFMNLDIFRNRTDYNSLSKKINSDSIDSDLGFFFEKKFFVSENEFSIKLSSSIGKEFLEDRKYKDIAKDEFDTYVNEKLEINSYVSTVFDVYLGVSWKKSVVTSLDSKDVYFGFTFNL